MREHTTVPLQSSQSYCFKLCIVFCPSALAPLGCSYLICVTFVCAPLNHKSSMHEIKLQ